MVRCTAICCTGRRCKRETADKLCTIHDNKQCEICKNSITIQSKLTLDCMHHFCKQCISEKVYKTQWYVEFSTDDPIKCPICLVEVSEYNWTRIMDLVVERYSLKRQFIYDTYLSHDLYKMIYPLVKIGKKYTNYELYPIHKLYDSNTKGIIQWAHDYYIPMNTTRIDIVYFTKSRFINEIERVYRFFLGDPILKEKFHEIEKELIEYCWHPSRIKNIEDLDNM